jgi:hypothetical protein
MTLIVSKLWMFISSSNQSFLEQGQYFIPLKRSFQWCMARPNQSSFGPLLLRGFMVKSQIPNLTRNPSLDHNSCILGLNKQQGNFR